MKLLQNVLSLTLLSMLLYAHPASSQNLLIGGTGSIGLSKLTLNRQIPGHHELKFTVSGNAGLFIEKKISDRSSVGAEVLWVQIGGVESIVDLPVTTPSGHERGTVTDSYYRHLSYLGIPIYYRFGIGKMGIKVGLQGMLLLRQSTELEMSGELDGEAVYYKGDWPDIEFNDLDYGPKVGLDYQLNDRLRMRVDYYHGFKSIIPYWIATLKKNRQISMGVSYDLHAKK